MKNIISIEGKFLTLKKETGERVFYYPKEMFNKLLNEVPSDDISQEDRKFIKEVRVEFNKMCKKDFWHVKRALPSQQKATAITMDEFNEFKEEIIYLKQLKDKVKKVNVLVNKFFPNSGQYEYDPINYTSEKANIRMPSIPILKYVNNLDKFVLTAHNEAKQKTQHKSYALYFETAKAKAEDESKKGFISSRNSSLTDPTVLASAKLFETPEEVKKFARIKYIDKFAVVEVDVKMKTVLDTQNTDAAEITSVIEKELVEDILMPSLENKKLNKMLEIIKAHNLEHLLNEEEKTVEVKKRQKI